MPAGKRRSSFTAWERVIVETDDPRWISAVRSRMEGSEAADHAAIRLTELEPTNIVGAAALLNYFADVEAGGSQIFPDNLEDENDPTPIEDRSARFGYFIARNVARGLVKMAGV